MSLSMPKLASFVIYDGIPPMEEGEDPTIYFYYPKSTPINNQLNEVGLYLTFTGFCRDFRSSKDCECFFTDKYLTVFSRMENDVCLCAKFETSDHFFQRICIQSINDFKKIYLMFFPSPQRLPDGKIDQKTLKYFGKKIISMIKLFEVPPFIKKILPSLELWTLCEEILSDIKSDNCHLKYGAVLFDGNIILNSMPDEDLCNLYFCLQANLLVSNNITSHSPDNMVVKVLKTPLKLTTTNGVPCIFAYQQRLLIILVFSQFSDTFSSIPAMLDPFNVKIYKQCAATLDLEKEADPPAYHESISKVTRVRPSRKESLFGEQLRTEKFEYFLNGTTSSFVKFSGKTDNDTWMVMEKINKDSTLLDIQGESMSSAIKNFSNFVNAANYS